MASLFRPEALDGQRHAWLGSIRLIRPLSLSVLTIFVVCAAAALMAYLVLGEYTRKARISGVLVTGTSSLNLQSSQTGAVLESHAREGQAGSPTPVLASAMPAAPVQARLYAPANVVGLLRPAQPVLLRYEAFPFQKFGHASGKVLEVSRTPLTASEGERPDRLPLATAAAGADADVLRAGADAGEPLYRVTVALDRQAVSADGQVLPLVPGMRLQADVLLDRRRLIEWLFEPVLGLAGRD